MDGDDVDALVIDHGSYEIKAGFAGVDHPKSIFHGVVGTMKHTPIMLGCGKEYWFGEDAFSKQALLRIHYPIYNDIVTNWDYMEKIWFNTFYNEIRVPPEEQPLLLTGGFLNNQGNKEKTLEIMFETFDVPVLKFENNAILSLCGCGKSTGVVVDCGYSNITCTPIINNCIQKEAIVKTGFGGKDINDYLLQLLIENGNISLTPRNNDVITKIKETMCYISIGSTKDIHKNETDIKRTYEQPDGKIISFNESVLFKCPEVLFNSSIFDSNQIEIHTALSNSIKLCNEQYQNDLYQNIILFGGSSLFPNFKERLQCEFSSLTQCNCHINDMDAFERKITSWVAASNVASQPTFIDSMITKADFEEHGHAVLNKNYTK